ncbi:STAS domain-containing protein [Amycolatopsis sp. cmx-11-12]|uniref:STAS domain-containing protein n=1 Tax=Amycolatopsis sp. cmx-11-12 TaxID=2785795 RepID=UPI0039185EB0
MKLITLDLRLPRRPRQDPTTLGAAPQTTTGLVSEGHEPPARCSAPLAVTVEQLGRTLVLVVDGDLDLHTAPTARQAIEAALSHRPRRLIVDLSLVQFLNSAGLEVLLTAHRQAAPHTDFRLVATTRAVWRPLQITRLHEQLIIHSSRSAAIAS